MLAGPGTPAIRRAASHRGMADADLAQNVVVVPRRWLRPPMEDHMIKRLVALLLLSLTLAGCIVEPGGGWGDRGHHAFLPDQGEHGNWGH
jgi:hypothetical protein